MFIHEELKHHYVISAPIGGGETNLTFKTGTNNDSVIRNYILNRDISAGPIEHFSVYETGLTIFFRETGSQIDVYSNKEFVENSSGEFELVNK